MFNKFSPMKDKALEADVLALAERAGIEGTRVYEVEKSADTKALNAYYDVFNGPHRFNGQPRHIRVGFELNF